MNPFLIDTHCHIHFPPYDNDRAEVLERMKAKNIWGITIGTGLKNSAAGLRFAEATNGVWATVGLHPEHVTSDYHDENEGEKSEKFATQEQLVEIAASSPKCVAIGETGLDYYRLRSMKVATKYEIVRKYEKEKTDLRSTEKYESTDEESIKKIQKEVFIEHIELAKEVGKPLMIHCRSAFADLIEILKTENKKLVANPGVIHFFSGTIEDARALLALGFSFSFGGVLTFTHDYDEVVRFIPLDRLLLETDAPFVAPTPYRGRRNEPAYIIETAKRVAELKNVLFEHICAQTTTNAREVFRL
mgnify:CR=1 FL=1